MAEARRIIGPRWAYYAREEARGFKLRNYPTEKDYWIDWLKLWPPEAVGVRIDDPHYRPDNRQFLYRWQFVEECFQQLVRHTLATALPLPPEAWPGGGV